MTLTEESLDLELTLALEPMCEDDHQYVTLWGDTAPKCATIATHQMTLTCEASTVLICTPLAGWLVAPPRATCDNHEREDHCRIRRL